MNWTQQTAWLWTTEEGYSVGQTYEAGRGCWRMHHHIRECGGLHPTLKEAQHAADTHQGVWEAISSQITGASDSPTAISTLGC